MPYLAIDRLSTSSSPNLNQVSFSVRDGECLAVIGEAGSGKTNLLEVIAGLIRPSSGEIRLDGQRIDRLKPAQRRLGMVFFDYALYPNMSVKMNLSFGMKVRRTPSSQITRNFDKLLACLPLEPFLKTQVEALSYREQALVALGRAVIDLPDLVLLDEPLARLANRDHEWFLQWFGVIRKEYNPTMLYVASSPEEAATVSDQVIVMHNGTILQAGKSDEIYYRPINIQVAQLASSLQAAKFFGTLSIQEHGPKLKLFDSLRIPLPPIYESRMIDGQPIIFLARPESFFVSSQSPEQAIPGKIISIRRILPDVLLQVRLSDDSIINVRANQALANALSVDEKINLELDIPNCLLFDRITGDALY